MNLNKVFLIGRVTNDLELKSTTTGSNVVKFGLATNRNYTDKSGKKVETSQFHNCVAFGKVADILSRFVKKGQEMMIEGRIEYRQWESKDGGKRYATDIMIENFQFGQKASGASRASAPAQEDVGLEEKGVPTIELDEESEDIKEEDLPF